MKVDAVILAGARNNGKLREISASDYEALISINDRPIVNYVIDALRTSEPIKRIVVVGPDKLRPFLDSRVEFVRSGESLAENIQRGIDYLDNDRMVLLVTSDIPLLHREAVEDFLDRCSEMDGDLFYPIVSKEANENAYPGVTRTYVHLKEGVFTGGNIALVSPRVIRDCHQFVTKVLSLRKKPLKLSRMLGLMFIIKFLFHRLTIAEIEKRVQDILGIKGVAVVSPYPEIGIDVDKPSDWELTEAAMVKGQTK